MADKKTQATVSEQLERLEWRTTQRENSGDYEQRATPGKWGAIISTIIQFQNRYNGQSPGNPHISKETGLSTGQVQYHLAEMEKRGLVVDKPGWPRRLVVQCSVKIAEQEEKATVPPAPTPVEAKVTNSDKVTNKFNRKRRESFMDRAKRFAQALTDYYDTHGEGPMIKELAPSLGYDPDRCGAVSRTVGEMVQRGWLFHRAGYQRDFMLTGLGRAALFGEVREDLHTDVLVRPPKWRQPFTTPARPFTARPVNEDTPEKDTRPEQGPQPPDREVPVVEMRRTKPSFSDIDTVDLVLEVQARGFKVSR
jgi:hypothetical protein